MFFYYVVGLVLGFWAGFTLHGAIAWLVLNSRRRKP